MIPINASLRNPYAPTATLCNGGATQVSKPSKRETEKPIVELVKKKEPGQGGGFSEKGWGWEGRGHYHDRTTSGALIFYFFCPDSLTRRTGRP